MLWWTYNLHFPKWLLEHNNQSTTTSSSDGISFDIVIGAGSDALFQTIQVKHKLNEDWTEVILKIMKKEETTINDCSIFMKKKKDLYSMLKTVNNVDDTRPIIFLMKGKTIQKGYNKKFCTKHCTYNCIYIYIYIYISD